MFEKIKTNTIFEGRVCVKAIPYHQSGGKQMSDNTGEGKTGYIMVIEITQFHGPFLSSRLGNNKLKSVS